MVRGRVTEFALQRLTTFRMRGMRATNVVCEELARLAAGPDLSLEHRVKIGVQKGWQLLYDWKFEAAKKLRNEILPMATTNMMPHQTDQA